MRRRVVVVVCALLAPVTSLEGLDAGSLANSTNASQGRRYLRTKRCSEGYNTYQRRSETGNYRPALEEPADCFEAVQGTDNPSPRSQRTRPGRVGTKNRFEMPEVLAHVSSDARRARARATPHPAPFPTPHTRTTQSAERRAGRRLRRGRPRRSRARRTAW